MKKLLLSLILLGLCAGCASSPENCVKLNFINIGKGDAFLLEVDDKNYVIDTGKKEDYPIIKKYLEIKDVESIDGVILSHGHKDHAGGLEDIVRDFPTDKIYVSASDDVTYKDINVDDVASEYGVEVVRVNKGDKLTTENMQMDFWIPANKDYEEDNNNSLIVKITYHNNRILMMGDATETEELEYMNDVQDVHANILKLGHHGEKNATSKAFLKQVKCEHAIITASLQENPESFDGKVQSRLDKYHVKGYDCNHGYLGYEFICDGNTINIRHVN